TTLCAMGWLRLRTNGNKRRPHQASDRALADFDNSHCGIYTGLKVVEWLWARHCHLAEPGSEEFHEIPRSLAVVTHSTPEQESNHGRPRKFSNSARYAGVCRKKHRSGKAGFRRLHLCRPASSERIRGPCRKCPQRGQDCCRKGNELCRAECGQI